MESSNLKKNNSDVSIFLQSVLCILTSSSCVPPWKGTHSKGIGKGQELAIIQECLYVCVCVFLLR